MNSQISLRKEFIEYRCDWLNRPVSHYILIAKTKSQNILLSHVNLFLFSHTRSSKKSSSRYIEVIGAFYKFLSTKPEFQNKSPWEYHRYASNQDIVNWQSARETERVRKNSISPSSETIYNDALLLMGFFKWLHMHGYPIAVKITLKTWIAKYTSSRYQEYVSLKAKNVLDSSSIRVLDKNSRQQRIRTLITVPEIEALATNYDDPVYSALLLFAVGTAMRPMDLCKFPYIGNGLNSHIMPYSSMGLSSVDDTGTPIITYHISLSKGRKNRSILIHPSELKTLEDLYIKPLYHERTAKYEARYGHKCPPSILFLTAQGRPVTPGKISARTNAAKARAKLESTTLRDNLRFYDARDWWPNYYLIRGLKDKLSNPDSEIYNTAMEQTIIAQMGHGEIGVTFKHYLSQARLILSLYTDQMHEIFNVSEDGARTVIKKLSLN
jgi:integrase